MTCQDVYLNVTTFFVASLRIEISFVVNVIFYHVMRTSATKGSLYANKHLDGIFLKYLMKKLKIKKLTKGTLLEKRVFILVHNPHLYRVLNRYKYVPPAAVNCPSPIRSPPLVFLLFSLFSFSFCSLLLNHIFIHTN
jgi:hypothetical protein